jgi:hypothetical protein
MTTTTNLETELLTINQAKSYMKCSHVFLWKRRKEGLIKTINAGKKVLIPKSSIDAYLKINQQEVCHA